MNWRFPQAQEWPRLPVGRLPVFSLQDLGDDRRLLVSGPLSQCLWDVPMGVAVVSRSPAGRPFRILRAGGEPLLLAGADERGKLELFALRLPPLTGPVGGEEQRAVIGPKLAVVPQAHAGPIRSLQFSFDGRRILTAGADGRVRLWSVQTLQQSPKLPVGETSREFRLLAVSSSGNRALASESDGRLRLWNSSECQPIRELAKPGSPSSALAVSADGQLAASAFENHLIRVWDAATGTLLHELQGHTASPLRLAFSSDGKRLVSADADATLRIWDLDRPGLSRLCKGHTGTVYYADFLAGDRRVVSAGEDGTVRFWDSADGRELQRREIPLTGRPAIAVAPGGDLAYVARKTSHGGGAVSVWNLDSGLELGRLPVRSAAVDGLHLAFRGRFLISAESSDNATVWDLRNPDRPFCELAIPRAAVAGLAFTSTAGYAVLAGRDGVLRSWDLPVYRILQNREN